MNGLSIIGCYMFSNILIEFTGILININLNLTRSPDEAISLWTQKVASIGSKPIIVIWIIFIIYSHLKLWTKVIIGTVLIFSIVSFELIFIHLGFLEFVQWNIFYEFLRYLVIVVLTVYYKKILENFMEKELST